METYIRSKQTESLPQNREIQNGDSRNHQNIPPTGGMGHLNRFQGRLFPYTNTGTVQEISEISCPGSDTPIQSTAVWSVHSTHGIYCGSKGDETDGHTPGYKNPPVPRRLVGEGQNPPGLSPAYSDPSKIMSGTRLASELGKVGIGTKTNLRLCRLPILPQDRSGSSDSGPVAKPSRLNSRNNIPTDLSCLAVHVTDRTINSHRKANSPRLTTHETHTVTSQKQLEGTRVTGKSDSSSQVSTSSLAMVAPR